MFFDVVILVLSLQTLHCYLSHLLAVVSSS